MNTDNLQQPLFEEPAFIDGVAGRKELPAEPQFISGEINRSENLTPLYADQPRPDPYHANFGNEYKSPLPLYGEDQKPIYADQVSGMNKLYPGQENFVGQQMNAVNGREVLTSGGVVQAAYVPPNYAEELEKEREAKTEHFNITEENQKVQLSPDTEHLHITAEPVVGGVEQVIRIKPDGRVTVTAEKVEEEEHLKKEVKVEKEKEHKKTKKDTKKKKHVEKVKREEPEETTTVVRVIEHEGTGHPKEKHDKHDETHKHSKKEHADKHDADGTKVKVNKEHHEVTHKHGKKEHADTHNDDGTKVKVKKEHHEETHKHGKKGHADTHKTKVKVNKEHHSHVPFLLAKHVEEINPTEDGGKKRSSGKKGDKSETTTVVKEAENDAGSEGKHKIEKTEKSKHHHGTDESKVKVEKEEHQHTI